MGTFGLTLANRGVIIGAVTVPELFDMAKRGEDSGAFTAVWVGDSLLAKPRLESIALLSALAVVTKKVRLAVGCMATFPQRHPALLAQQWTSLDVISGGRAWLAVCLGGVSILLVLAVSLTERGLQPFEALYAHSFSTVARVLVPVPGGYGVSDGSLAGLLNYLGIGFARAACRQASKDAGERGW